MYLIMNTYSNWKNGAVLLVFSDQTWGVSQQGLDWTQVECNPQHWNDPRIGGCHHLFLTRVRTHTWNPRMHRRKDILIFEWRQARKMTRDQIYSVPSWGNGLLPSLTGLPARRNLLTEVHSRIGLKREKLEPKGRIFEFETFSNWFSNLIQYLLWVAFQSQQFLEDVRTKVTFERERKIGARTLFCLNRHLDTSDWISESISYWEGWLICEPCQIFVYFTLLFAHLVSSSIGILNHKSSTDHQLQQVQLSSSVGI